MSTDGRCSRCGRACDGCPLCCHEHPAHRVTWEPWGCSECTAAIFADSMTPASPVHAHIDREVSKESTR